MVIKQVTSETPELTHVASLKKTTQKKEDTKKIQKKEYQKKE